MYDLTPGGFLDFGDDVQAAGLTWGAAKAHVHRHRRRVAPRGGGPVVAVAPNIMDQSKFSGVSLVRSAEEAMVLEPSLLLVDVDRVKELDAFVSAAFPTIGFGSHVDEVRLNAARDAGFAEVLPRSSFFKRLPTLLGGRSGGGGGE